MFHKIPCMLICILLSIHLRAEVLPDTKPVAQGVEYFLSPSGQNSADGSTPGTAWRTFYKALQVLEPGDTLTLLDGTYREAWVRVKSNGTPEAPITLRAQNRHQAVLTLPEEDYRPSNSILAIQEASHLIVDGLLIRGVADRDDTAVGSGHGIDITGSHHITIRNCRIEYAGGSGISGTCYFWQVDQHVATVLDHILIENNHIAFCGFYNTYQTSGISFYQPRSAGLGDGPEGFNIIVRNNRVWGCENKVNTSGHSKSECDANPGVAGYLWNEFTVTDGNGIIIDDFRCKQNAPGQGPPYPHNTLVENNVVFANGGRGVHVFSSDRVTLRHNTAWGNGLALPGDFKAELNNAFGSDNHWYNNIGISTPESLAANSQALLFAGDSSTGCTFVNNLLVGPVVSRDGGANLWTRAQLEAAGILSDDAGLFSPGKDPLTADFRILPDSPARDAGSAAEGHSTHRDLAGTPRPQGAAPDIGAYEFIVEDAANSSLELWRQLHFSAEQLADPAASGNDAYPANDGVPNLVKYFMGLNPWQPAPPSIRPVGAYSGEEPERFVFSYWKRKDTPDAEGLVEWSATLEAGSWSTDQISPAVVADDELYEWIEASIPLDGRDILFMRLRVTPSPDMAP